MKARLLLRERQQVRADAFVSLLVWAVPEAVRGSAHTYKYSVAFVVGGVCVLRFDNEAGKGDHKHIGATETPYRFTTPEQLLSDFWREVDQWSTE
jgi:hypothetical protein